MLIMYSCSPINEVLPRSRKTQRSYCEMCIHQYHRLSACAGLESFEDTMIYFNTDLVMMRCRVIHV
jgi:hypothetical protein